MSVRLCINSEKRIIGNKNFKEWKYPISKFPTSLKQAASVLKSIFNRFCTNINGRVNKWNILIGRLKTPITIGYHIFSISKKVKIWAGISSNHTLGPIFLRHFVWRWLFAFVGRTQYSQDQWMMIRTERKSLYFTLYDILTRFQSIFIDKLELISIGINSGNWSARWLQNGLLGLLIWTQT